MYTFISISINQFFLEDLLINLLINLTDELSFPQSMLSNAPGMLKVYCS